MKYTLFLIICFSVCITSKAIASITTVTIYEKDGITTENYPLTFGHVFKKGDAVSNVSVKVEM